MRLSNTSIENEELQVSNLPDTLIRLEEANAPNAPEAQRDALSGSAKSSNSTDQKDRSSAPLSNRLGSRVVSLKSGTYTATPPLVNIVVDLNTSQVSEMQHDKIEQVMPQESTSMMTKLKSAASVMQSSLMGFGFGQGVKVPNPVVESEGRRYVSFYFDMISS